MYKCRQTFNKMQLENAVLQLTVIVFLIQTLNMLKQKRATITLRSSMGVHFIHKRYRIHEKQ